MTKQAFVCQPLLASLVLALACAGNAPAFAQTSAENADVMKQIAILREQQAQIAQLQQQNEAALRALEAKLGVTAPPPAVRQAPAATPAVTAVTASATPSVLDRLKVTGDFRLRSQHDRSDADADARDRTSGQIRARLGATFAVNDLVTVGGRV
ncbi:MAG: hypothetical protein DI562_02340, partial [Stenotrophomonas acidaminiphila]